LNIEIGGTIVDSLYDRLNISGVATLGGTLTIDLVNGFLPALGDTFVIMTYNSYTGSFDEINGINTGSGVSFEVNIGSTDIKLIAAESPNSAPSVFKLLAPADEGVLSKIDTLNFIWQASSDMDEDMIHYTLNIQGGTLDTNITNIPDTAFTIIDEGIWQENTVYQWTVLVSDGMATTASPDTFSFTSPPLLSLEDDLTLVPDVHKLEQNYPNPFNPATKIKYQLPINNYVELTIYNVLGQKVIALVNEFQPAGKYQVQWNALGFPSGLYYYQLIAGDFVDVRRMILLR